MFSTFNVRQLDNVVSSESVAIIQLGYPPGDSMYVLHVILCVGGQNYNGTSNTRQQRKLRSNRGGVQGMLTGASRPALCAAARGGSAKTKATQSRTVQDLLDITI